MCAVPKQQVLEPGQAAEQQPPAAAPGPDDAPGAGQVACPGAAGPGQAAADDQDHAAGAGPLPAHSPGWQQVLMSGLVIGSVLPMRVSAITYSIQQPTYTGPCLHPDCQEPLCKGNRLTRLTRDPRSCFT